VEVGNLLQTRYRETGVMDFGFKHQVQLNLILVYKAQNVGEKLAESEAFGATFECKRDSARPKHGLKPPR